MINKLKIGENITNLIKMRCLQIGEIAKKTGIPYSTLHTWLNGRPPKDINKVKNLADFFEITLDDLLFGDCSQLNKKKVTPILNFEGQYEITSVMQFSVKKLL